MTKYIKDKNGKFAGSIGTGKTAVPTSAPTRPDLPAVPQTNEPMVFPRAVNFTDLVSRHARAYSELARYGISPKQAATYSHFDSSYYQVLVPGHLHHHLSQPLYSPEELSEIYSNLGDIDHNQKRVLIDLEYLSDSSTEFAEFRKEECYDCGRDAYLNVPEMYTGDYCERHQHIRRIDNLYDVSGLIEDAQEAVEEDYRMEAEGDREAAIVLTSLLPDPYKMDSLHSKR